jgi:hypothetical protein
MGQVILIYLGGQKHIGCPTKEPSYWDNCSCSEMLYQAKVCLLRHEKHYSKVQTMFLPKLWDKGLEDEAQMTSVCNFPLFNPWELMVKTANRQTRSISSLVISCPVATPKHLSWVAKPLRDPQVTGGGGSFFSRRQWDHSHLSRQSLFIDHVNGCDWFDASERQPSWSSFMFWKDTSIPSTCS